MAGDSLVREQFNGLGSYLEDNFEAKRIHADSFWWRRPDGIDVHVEFIWFYTFFDIARAFWYNSERRASPSGFNDSLDAQLLVTNVNAVWQLWFDSDCAIERRLQQFVHAMRALPKPQQRIFISGVYPHGMRQSYVFPPRMERLNTLAQRLLGSVGFRTLDAYNTSKLAGNVSVDGMHLRGPAAPVLTRMLIGMLCGSGGQK